MEQQLDATYLRPCFVSKAFALSIAAIGFGTSILLAAYGISLLLRPTQTAIDIRIANPELFVRQEKPFVMASPETLRVDQRALTNQPGQVLNTEHSNRKGDPIAPREEVIQREVIAFSGVKHANGSIVTGWKYPNGSGRTPSEQFCYYSSTNADRSSMRVDIAVNGAPLNEAVLALVPESEHALEKCQWWHA
jgi:hypothetical protein